MKCTITDSSFKYLSIFISLIISILYYKILLTKNVIILNYELDNNDIIDKCYN